MDAAKLAKRAHANKPRAEISKEQNGTVDSFKARDRWQRQVMAASNLSPTCRLVAIRLALFLNTETGRCDPSYATIGAEIGRDRRTAIRAVATLIEARWLAETDSNGRRSNNFRLLLQPPNGDTDDTVEPANGDKSDRPTVTKLCHPNSEVNSEEGRKGEARTERAPPPPEAGLFDQIVSDASGQLPPQPPPQPPQAPTRGTRLSRDWQPSLADRAYAERQGLTPAEIERAEKRFRKHYVAKHGPNALSCDWPVTWETWIDGDVERKALRGSNHEATSHRGRNGYQNAAAAAREHLERMLDNRARAN